MIARTTARRLHAVATVVVAGAVAACAALAPVRDESRYYVLNAVAGGGRARIEPSLPDLVVGVGPVAIPQYLDRSELVARAGAHEIAPVPRARWGEPLQPNLARVLAEDLAVELGTGQVVVFPWFGPVQPVYGVAVEVQRFEMQEDGTVSLHARWTLHALRPQALVAVHEARIAEPADRTDAGTAAAAMSRAVARLSEEIALEIREAQRIKTARPAPATKPARRDTAIRPEAPLPH